MTRLKTRLFLWFLAAIVVASVSSSVTVAAMRPESPRLPSGMIAKDMATRLESIWDDPEACEAYLAEMRELSGHSFELRRDPRAIPEKARPHRGGGGRRGRGAFLFEDGTGYIPVMRQGEVIGAVVFPHGAANARWWRLFAGLLAGALVLVIAAQRVSRDLARPLERVADAANRFGAGELAARTGIGSATNVSDEVHQVATAFDAMAARVEETLRDQRELLAAISHELRSPLGRARVALDIARESEPATSNTLDRVDRQLVEVDAILSDLLAVTRAGLTDLRTEKVGYLAWLRLLIAQAPGERAGDVELVTDTEAMETIQVSIDGALLGRAIHNLLANARTHGHPEAEPLVLHVSMHGDRLRTELRDRGPGIPSELLPRIFDAFVRGDNSRARTRGAGTGLGLALVRRIVEAHGGSVFAKNSPHGAEVGFELPAKVSSSTHLSHN